MGESFNLYLQNRPIKEAFIINTDSPDALNNIEQVIEYCQTKWGGGYNQIILISNQDISDDWMKYMYAYDPDVIKYFEEIPESVKDKICYYINHMIIEDFNTQGYRTSALSIFPQKQNIYNKKLFLFKKNCRVELPQSLDKFVKYNFGWYQDLMYQEKLLEAVPNKEVLIIESEQDLIKFFNEQLKQYGLNFTQRFQAQISLHANNHFSEPSNRIFNRNITVYIGDTINSHVNFWNSSLRVDSFHQEFLHKLFLPYDLVFNDSFLESFLKWIERYADMNNENCSKIKFEIADLSEEQIFSINSQLEKFSRRYSVEKSSPIEIPQGLNSCTYNCPPLNESFWGVRSKFEPPQPVELHNLLKERVSTITTQRPTNNIAETNEYYVTDIYVQEFEQQSILTRFPKRLKSMSKLIVPHNLSKINFSHNVSCLRRYGDKALKIYLPDDEEIFDKLLKDQQYNRLEDRITKIKTSDKGLYLKGLVGIFDDFVNLQDYLGNIYWDKIFKILSGTPDKREYANWRDLKNKLEKHVLEVDNKFLHSEEGVNYLASLVVHSAKSYNENIKGLSYETLKCEAENLLREFEKTEDYKELISDDAEMFFCETTLKNSINNLLEKNILQLGINVKCNRCGTFQWYSIDKLNSKFKCPNCDENISILAEQQWRYKLNTIVSTAYRNDIVPVALALNQLLRTASQSFMFTPSRELYLNNNDKNPFTDLDIICIVDGEFIIGEVKKSQSNFKSGDFEKLVHIAKILKPDKVVLSALDITSENKVIKTLSDGFNKMYEELKKHNIKTEIIEYQTPPFGLDVAHFSDMIYYEK